MTSTEITHKLSLLLLSIKAKNLAKEHNDPNCKSACSQLSISGMIGLKYLSSWPWTTSFIYYHYNF